MLGRFLQADSVVMPESTFGMNRYMYVEGNPVRFGDESGHRKQRNLATVLVSKMLISKKMTTVASIFSSPSKKYRKINAVEAGLRWAMKNTSNGARVTGEQWEDTFLRRRHPNMRWDFNPVADIAQSGAMDIAGEAIGGSLGELLAFNPWIGIPLFLLRVGVELNYDMNGKRPRKENKFGTSVVIFILFALNIGDIQGHANNLANQTSILK